MVDLYILQESQPKLITLCLPSPPPPKQHTRSPLFWFSLLFCQEQNEQEVFLFSLSYAGMKVLILIYVERLKDAILCKPSHQKNRKQKTFHLPIIPSLRKALFLMAY